MRHELYFPRKLNEELESVYPERCGGKRCEFRVFARIGCNPNPIERFEKKTVYLLPDAESFFAWHVTFDR